MYATFKDLEKQLILLQDVLKKAELLKDKLLKKAELLENQKPKRWQDKLAQPSEGYYYYIGNGAPQGFRVLESYKEDRKPEHAFRTGEQAELEKEKVLLMIEMHAFAHVGNEGWVADWNDKNVPKHGILDNTFNGLVGNAFRVGVSYCFNYFVFGISVKSEEIAKEMLSIFGERIEKYYNQQY